MEKQQFKRSADQYKDMIFRIALNYFGNVYDAEDIVQDVLMKLYITETEFDSEEHIRFWIIRVTINKCKNILKCSWFSKHATLDEVTASIPFKTNEQSELFVMLMELPEKYRVVLYLFYYEELSVKEIGDMLHMKESAVTTRLSRARQKLKSRLLGEGRTENETGLIY
ncbi:MAG: sigma-70 family RNA polymerase sigma factor [bacterium]|nr:sigma-70 family RNA polymerase sigma factor [bacterium]